MRTLLTTLLHDISCECSQTSYPQSSALSTKLSAFGVRSKCNAQVDHQLCGKDNHLVESTVYLELQTSASQLTTLPRPHGIPSHSTHNQALDLAPSLSLLESRSTQIHVDCPPRLRWHCKREVTSRRAVSSAESDFQESDEKVTLFAAVALFL